MKSFTIGHVWGIKLQLHWSFVLFFLLIGGLLFLFTPESAPGTLLLFFFLFLSVLLHELSHSVVSLHQGLGVSRIVLLPIGGMALTDGMPENPWDEFWIAIAGPIFNFIVVGVLLFTAWAFALPFPWGILSGSFDVNALQNAMLTYPLFGVLYVNLILGAFNLFFPALPLDGGRVARSLLSVFAGHARATEAVGRASVALAVLLFLFGLFAGSLLVMVVAVFVYLGARQETELARLQDLLRSASYHSLLERTPLVFPPEVTVREAVRVLLGNSRSYALVKTPMAWGYVVADELAELGRDKHNDSVASHARPVDPVSTDTPAPRAALRLVSSSAPAKPVLNHEGHFIGSLDIERIEQVVNQARLEARFASFNRN